MSWGFKMRVRNHVPGSPEPATVRRTGCFTLKSMVSAVLLAALLLQAGTAEAPVPLNAGPSSRELPLVEAQSLVDLGKFREAEDAVRRYLGTHADSADAHYLLGYLLFRQQI